MGPEETNHDGSRVYLNGVHLGDLTIAPEIEAQESMGPESTAPESMVLEGKPTLRFAVMASQWTRCKTRKRFIKLSCGLMGVQKRQAEALARAAMKNGCPSYQDLWADCLAYFIREITKAILIQERIIEESTRDLEFTVEVEPGQTKPTDSPAGLQNKAKG